MPPEGDPRALDLVLHLQRGALAEGTEAEMTATRRKRRKPPLRMKDGELSASFGYLPDHGDTIYYTNGAGCHSADSRVLAYAVEDAVVHDGKSLRKLLEDRGYDMKTFRFTIQKLPAPPAPVVPTPLYEWRPS